MGFICYFLKSKGVLYSKVVYIVGKNLCDFSFFLKFFGNKFEGYYSFVRDFIGYMKLFYKFSFIVWFWGIFCSLKFLIKLIISFEKKNINGKTSYWLVENIRIYI